MHRARKPLRLLVVDEAIAIGGVERLWRALMPELAKRCEHLVWMLPQHRIDADRKQGAPTGIHLESFLWRAGSAGKFAHAVVKRTARAIGPASFQARLDQWFDSRRLHAVIRAHGITHVLYPALFRQPFAELRRPTFAAVMDVNYHPSIAAECVANLPQWAERAACLISISDFTRDEIVRLLPQYAAKVVSIPIASEGTIPSSTTPLRLPAEPRAATLYYPASLNPHKGHATLIEAVALLARRNVEVRLIFTGGGTDKLLANTPLGIPALEAARMVLAALPAEVRQRIDVRGMVPVEEVDACFAAADLVTLPSRYEGFGLPLAEAVAREKRVLCSDIPAFREQLGLYGFEKAVTLVKTNEPAAWADAIEQALAQKSAPPYSSAELCEIFNRWTWADVADRYVEVLRSS